MSTRTPRRTGQPGRPGYDLDSLLSVAVKVFNDRGYDGTSMEVLSQKLGISKSSIYHHVSGKTELLRLALDRALDALFAVTEEEPTTNGPAIDRLEHMVRRSVEVLVDELPYVTLLLRVRGNTTVERRALARRRELDAFVAKLVVDAEAEGDLRPDIDPALTSRLLFGTVNSLIEWYNPQGGGSTERLADAVVAMTFDGLRTTRP
ncbi:TetR/AcrR family transcriptional regulator [Rhodococcus sp. NPDC127528]|uniref:TetR/AcrR family transcriptional regulator n=1 Tax=unclassified Rhodococcus (in: high G+C Gram-positive bacteria) TaxID=192944 RepID=UPI00363CB660